MKKKNMESSIFISHRLPSLKKVLRSVDLKKKQALVVCDKKFQKHPLLKKWTQKENVIFYFVSSGEKLKSFENFPLHIRRIHEKKQNFDKRSFVFIGLGGGSLLDFVGFLASIYQRGIEVVYFPTTWLAVLDSAHGGKTALNFQNIKNLLGTYHFPKAVFIVKAFLNQNSAGLKQSAMGELLKMALIAGDSLYKKFKITHTETDCLEKLFKMAIQAKWQVVSKDPYENSSLRKKLNLGHTVGHILEALYPLPHGIAVIQGLTFSLNWSLKKKFVTKQSFKEIKNLLPKQKTSRKIPTSLFKKHLRQDKKYIENSKIDFVFIKKPGFVFVKSVTEKDLFVEAKRQGLCL